MNVERSRNRRGEGRQQQAPREQAAGSLGPGHVFFFGALIAASGAALTVGRTSPANVILVSLTMLAAGVVAFTFYRTLVPLVTHEEASGPEMLGGRTRAALEREKMLALRAIKDLEFDRAMGKVSEADFREMSGRLRARAIRLIRQLDEGTGGYRELIERELAARLGKRTTAPAAPPSDRSPSAPAREELSFDPGAAPDTAGTVFTDVDREETLVEISGGAVRPVCPSCDAVNDFDARFCKQCGTRLPAPA